MVATFLNPPFFNQDEAFNRVQGSMGRILVLDALPGYGKTAFLKKLQQEYCSRSQWSCHLVTLETEGMRDVALIRLILKAFGHTDLDQRQLQHVSVEEAAEMLEDHIADCINGPTALFIDDIHHLDPAFIPWLLNRFCQELGGYLREASPPGQFLLIFAGRNLRSRGNWPVRETAYIPLTPFQHSFPHTLSISRLIVRQILTLQLLAE